MLGSRGAKIPELPLLKIISYACVDLGGGVKESPPPPPGKISKLLFSHIKLL